MSVNSSQRSHEGGPQSGTLRYADESVPRIRKEHDRPLTTAVVLDRDPMWLQAVERMLARLEIEVVGATTSCRRALALVADRKPDLLVAETVTGESSLDGIACLRAAKKHVPGIRTIVLSGSRKRDDIRAALSAGASAYVCKAKHPEDLALALRQGASKSSVHLADLAGASTVDLQSDEDSG